MVGQLSMYWFMLTCDSQLITSTLMWDSLSRTTSKRSAHFSRMMYFSVRSVNPSAFSSGEEPFGWGYAHCLDCVLLNFICFIAEPRVLHLAQLALDSDSDATKGSFLFRTLVINVGSVQDLLLFSSLSPRGWRGSKDSGKNIKVKKMKVKALSLAHRMYAPSWSTPRPTDLRASKIQNGHRCAQ